MLRLLIPLMLLLFACRQEYDGTITVQSPDGQISLSFSIDNGQPSYAITVGSTSVIEPSTLGYALRGQADLVGPFQIQAMENKGFDEVWEPIWGQENQIRNHFNEVKLALQEIAEPYRGLTLYFRVFNDGVGFRYEIPALPGLDSLFIRNELTEFNFSTNGEAWWNDGAYLFDTPEQLYKHTPLSAIDSANTPLTYINEDGLYISIHEANLTDYAGMTLKKDTADSLRFYSALVPWPDGDKVKSDLPLQSPWRTITIGRSAGDLLRSRLILNLNEPNTIHDVSWIQPMKYVGIWWGMHINKYTWVQGERHGATTKNTKAYIDFAAENNIQGVLAEGWNQGWEKWGQDDALNLTTPYDDFDMKAVTDYAREKGIAFIGHHETTANVTSYEKQLDTAFAYYAGLGIHAVKTGYVGSIKPNGQFHYGQWMVQHYRRVVQLAAKYHITLDVHEPVKATGIERTWPNMMTREGARGLEYNAWSEGNPPEHTTILPFTRLLAGPMDYTPGIFDIRFDRYKSENKVHTTLAKQLALMVVLYSPLQMASDLPENYINQPAFQFVRDLVTDWDETRILEADIGEQVAIARRAGSIWFIGAITNKTPRTFVLPLSELLDDNRVAECYMDGALAHWDSNPTSIHLGSYIVTPQDTLKAEMAPGGGLAIRMRPAREADENLAPIAQLVEDQHKSK